MIFGRNITKRRSRILAVNTCNLLYFVMFSIIKKRKSYKLGRDIRWRMLRLGFDRLKIAVNKPGITARCKTRSIRFIESWLRCFQPFAMCPLFETPPIFQPAKNATIITWKPALLCESFRFSRLLTGSQWTFGLYLGIKR